MSCYELISVVLSLAAIIISGYVFIKNKGFSSSSLELEIRNQISSAASALSKSNQDFAVFQHDQDSPLKDSIGISLDDSIDSYLSAYDEACSKYFRRQVRRSDFKKNYSFDITVIFSNELFYDHLSNDRKYHYLKKFNSEINK